jgi:hypothetical protein
MITIKIEGLDKIRRQLDEAQRQARYAAAVALTRTAAAIAKAEEQEVSKVFDSPTTFTKRAFGIKPATKANLRAEVFIKDAQARYLRPAIYGGHRNQKSFEKKFAQQTGGSTWWVPGPGVKLNAAGNLTIAQVKALAANLGTTGKYGRVFFGQPHPGMAVGIYGTKRGRGRSAAGALVPLLLQASRAPTYRKRFDFFGVAQRMAGAEFQRQFDIAFAHAMRTAR